MNRRTTVLLAAAAALGALSLAGPAHADGSGDTDGAGPGAEFNSLVQTGDIDLLEDVLEHITVPLGDHNRTVHQLYNEGTEQSD